MWRMTTTSGVVGSSSSSSDCPTALPVDSHDPSLQPRRRLIQRTLPTSKASRRTGRMRPWRAIVAANAAHRCHRCHWRQQQSLQARG
jgi:hypothetical protein